MRFAPILLASICASAITAFSIPMLLGPAANARPGVFAEGDVAVCDVIALADELMESDRYKPGRESKQEELNEAFQSKFEARQASLQDRFADAQANQDQAAMQALQQEYLAYQQEFQDAQQQLLQDFDEYVASQFQEVYNAIRDSAKAVADDMGYAYVSSSSDPAEDFDAGGMASLQIEVLGRTFLSFPEDADITEDVRDDLNL